jgi:hypothetical protein
MQVFIGTVLWEMGAIWRVSPMKLARWGLGKLIVFYEDKHISIDGDTVIAFTKDVSVHFDALGRQTVWVKNGNDNYDEICKAIQEEKSITDKPTNDKGYFLLLPENCLCFCCCLHFICSPEFSLLGDYHNRFRIYSLRS